MQPERQIESRMFSDDGETPNHPRLPLVLVRHVLPAGVLDAAAWFEKTFESHGWSSTWRWTVYPFHHFHTTNHEVLGVARGTATLMLGGAAGGEFKVEKGDVIIIPAGVGHKRLASSGDFQVVGGYPGGEEPDLVRPGEEDIGSCRERIANVPLPSGDPLDGPGGPLSGFWKER